MIKQLRGCEQKTAFIWLKRNHGNTATMRRYLETKVHVGRVESVADDRGLAPEGELVCGASFNEALGHHFLPGVFLSVEGHCDLLLFPRLEAATLGHKVKHLQTQRPRFRPTSTFTPPLSLVVTSLSQEHRCLSGYLVNTNKDLLGLETSQYDSTW